MNEETKRPEAPPTEEPQPREVSEAEERPLPEIGEEELARILEAHGKWVESEEKEGERANLVFTNLQGAYLLFTKLQGANLQGADLRYATGLTQEQLDSACGDEKTRLPPDMSSKPCPEELLDAGH